MRRPLVWRPGRCTGVVRLDVGSDGTAVIAGRVQPIRKGDVVVLPAMTLHQFKAAQDTTAIEIVHPKLTPEMMQKLKGSAGEGGAPFLLHACSTTEADSRG